MDQLLDASLRVRVHEKKTHTQDVVRSDVFFFLPPFIRTDKTHRLSVRALCFVAAVPGPEAENRILFITNT